MTMSSNAFTASRSRACSNCLAPIRRNDDSAELGERQADEASPTSPPAPVALSVPTPKCNARMSGTGVAGEYVGRDGDHVVDRRGAGPLQRPAYSLSVIAEGSPGACAAAPIGGMFSITRRDLRRGSNPPKEGTSGTAVSPNITAAPRSANTCFFGILPRDDLNSYHRRARALRAWAGAFSSGTSA